MLICRYPVRMAKKSLKMLTEPQVPAKGSLCFRVWFSFILDSFASFARSVWSAGSPLAESCKSKFSTVRLLLLEAFARHVLLRFEFWTTSEWFSSIFRFQNGPFRTSVVKKSILLSLLPNYRISISSHFRSTFHSQWRDGVKETLLIRLVETFFDSFFWLVIKFETRFRPRVPTVNSARASIQNGNAMRAALFEDSPPSARL